MARIGTYKLDDKITKSDKLLGTSGSDTRNFSLEDLKKYLGGSGVTGNFCTQFVNSSFGGSPEQQSGQMTITGLSGTSKPFSQVTSLVVSEFPFDKTDTGLQRLNFFKEKKVIISQVDNTNNFGIFKVDNITPVSGKTVHTVDLTFEEGNGSLSNLDNYNINLLPEGADKHQELIFTSSNFVTVGGSLQFETINGSSMCYIDFEHNLNKKPSVTVEQEGSPGQIAMMPVKYIDNNKVRVYFGGTTSGKIFAN
tara:strand:+ start:474 stop:1229 length:756 start_codon:yes stop_codon:yes gene_type:complete